MTTTIHQIRSAQGSRSAGERAFDRCFFPFALYLFYLIALAAVFEVPPSSDPDMPGVPPVFVWVLFALGILLSIHWVWALRSVIAAWRDPFARVLRFSSLALLIFAGAIICGLVRLPYYAAH